MRQISPYRPEAKVRGIPRRLRALRKWADGFEGYYPLDELDMPYCNWRIPVLDRMVEGPRALPEVQRICMQEMLRATAYLIEARSQHIQSRVTLCLNFPDMFSSDICIFQSPEYRASYFDRDNEWQHWIPIKSDDSLVKQWGLSLPASMKETGYRILMKDDETGDIWESEMWVLGELEEFE